jgi:hypothetical protein
VTSGAQLQEDFHSVTFCPQVHVLAKVLCAACRLQDWKTITKVLLTERAKDELPESDATNLVRLLNASVKKVHGEKLVKDTDGKAVHVTKAQRVRLILDGAELENFQGERCAAKFQRKKHEC